MDENNPLFPSSWIYELCLAVHAKILTPSNVILNARARNISNNYMILRQLYYKQGRLRGVRFLHFTKTGKMLTPIDSDKLCMCVCVCIKKLLKCYTKIY